MRAQAPAQGNRPSQARSCILIWMDGGPTHYETFDPKPSAPSEIRGEFSPIARRPYCRECGTSLGFQFKEGSDKMDLTVASFDDPSRFSPKHHFGAESIHRAWLNTEGLPEMRTEDYPVLVDKWVEATGSFPG